MADNIDIVVKDKIDASISNKLRRIGNDAIAAEKHISELSSRINALSSAPFANISAATAAAATAAAKAANAQSNAANAMDRSALSAAKLATEQQRTALASARVTNETDKSILSIQRLATETERTAAAANKSAAAQAKLATEQQKTLAATNAAAQAKIRLEAAQNRVAAAALREASSAANAAAANARQAREAANAAAANDKNARSLRGAAAASTVFARAAAAIGAAAGVSQVVGMADAYTTMQNKLQNVSESQEQVNELTNRLFVIANTTRSSVEATTTSFARFDRSLKQMGKSQEDTLRMTETVNKALIVSGATSSEAASSLIQLSQAFNRGKLQGDEFRAISENMPVVLDAVAKKLGVPINKVQDLATAGKITAEILVDAFKSIEGSIDKTFAKTTPTVSQALTVLRNNAVQFFGELDKKLGVTSAMSNAIIFLGSNLDKLAIIAAVAGAVLVVTFGPALLAAIGAATIAMMKFSLVLLANPIGLVIIAATALIATIVIMGDKIDAGIDGFTTLKDLGVAAFRMLSGAVSDVIDSFMSLFKSSDETTTTILNSTNSTTDGMTASWNGFFNTQETGWAKILVITARVMDGMVGIVMVAVNYVLEMFSMLFNTAKAAGEGIAKSLMGSPIEAAKGFVKTMNSLEVRNPVEAWAKANKDASENLNAYGFEANAKKIIESSKAISAARKEASKKNSTLRGKGVNTLGADDEKSKKGGGKGQKSRSEQMSDINAKLDSEIKYMNMLAPLREQSQKFDQIEAALLQNKITMTDKEKENTRAKIKTIYEGAKVQSEMDRIYQDAIGPMETHNSILKASEMLLKQGAISRAQYNQQVLKSSEAYKNAMDPMREEMQALQDQNTLLNYLPKQREIEAKMMELVNSKKRDGIELSAAQLGAYQNEITMLQAKNALDAEQNSLLEGSIYAREKFVTQLQAIKALQANPSSGFTAGDQAASSDSILGSLGIDTATLRVGMDAKIAMYQTQYEQLAQMRAADLISESDHANARAQIWGKEFRAKHQQADAFFAGLAELQSSSIREMSQLGKAAAITQAIINTYEGATKALAQGGIYGGVMAAMVVAQGLSQVAAIRSQGFKNGGFTGYGNDNEEAGPVHKNEFVMTANTTRRVGQSDLKALQNGSARVQRNNANAGSSSAKAVAQNVSQNVVSNPQPVAQPTAVTVINSLDPAMVGDFLATPAGEQVLVNTIRRNGEAIKYAVGS